MGPLIPGGILSLNHWSIFLLVPGGSVQLNMKNSPDPHSNRGVFEIRDRAYDKPHSAVRMFDLPAKPGVTVDSVEREIRDRKWDQYDMNESGAGCRWWIRTVMRGLAEKNYVEKDKVRALLKALRYNYPKKGKPILLEMKKGVFCSAKT
ncbi:hypothetical protein BDU57DRAFT_191942 [Ampelomyces quisqualis]|uniref:DUF7770 domain-containing protein n=1 Tax=Ampelomyces quisqualis TaxID=50730 RepID=A0A6A5QS54_AMPQU|nr:hypothetical protein BDU57DRAFT_191942 [Ampelomyces quisqualis]